MARHLNIKLYGRVQGVTFRYWARAKAHSLGLSGFAQNRSDGTLYIEVEGEDEALDIFSKWCHSGPSWAQVTNCQIEIGEMKNFSDFEIIY